MTKLTKWYRIKNGFIPAALLLIFVMIALLCFGKNPLFLAIDGILVCSVSAITASVIGKTDSKINCFKKHIGFNDLSYMAQVSAGEMEQMCFCRLQALAEAVSKAEHEQSTPLLLEEHLKITQARVKFSEAYWFFEEHKFIKSAEWDHFFPPSKPETRK